MTAPAVEGVDRSTGEIVALTTTARKQVMLRPIAEPGEILQVQNETRAFVKAALTEGRDFGTFPGVDKKSLFKAGAERVCAAFAVYPRFRIVEKEVDHDREVKWRKTKAKWGTVDGRRQRTGEEITEGISLGLYRYVIECDLVSRETDVVVGSAIASCSTMESKYVDRPRDAENTTLQMAEKRSHVAATRTAFGLSEEFTQDIEENPDLYARGADAGEARPAGEPEAKCPACQKNMWDNRPKKAAGEMKPNAPDFKCKDRSCDGKYWPGQWPPKPEEKAAAGSGSALTLGDAKALVFKGKPLAEISTEKLQEISAWIIEKDSRKRQHDETLRAIGLVLGDCDQASLELEEKKTAPAPSGAVPKAGKVSDALEPNGETLAALTDEADDLPF